MLCYCSVSVTTSNHCKSNTVRKRWLLYFITLRLSDDSQLMSTPSRILWLQFQFVIKWKLTLHWRGYNSSSTSHEGYADNKSCIFAILEQKYCYFGAQLLISRSTNEIRMSWRDKWGMMHKTVKYQVSKHISITSEYVRRVKV